jgi:hypothetical protein
MLNIEKKKNLLLISILTGLIIALPTQAASTQSSTNPSGQIKFTPQVGLPGFTEERTFTSNSTVYIAELMKKIFNYGVQIITVLSLLVVIIGGFLWSIAGGNGQKVGEAKQWIFSGLGGLALTLFAYLILQTINVNLVTFKPAQINIVGGLDLMLSRKSEPNQYFPDAAQKTMTIAESTDPNGKKACCLIRYVGLAGPRSLYGVDNIQCATLQATYYRGPDNSTEQQCVEFFNNTTLSPYSHIDNVSQMYDINNFVYTEESVPAQSAILLVGDFCEKNTSLATLCMGKDHPNYCQTRSVGSECITQDNYWGYCNKEKKCVRCKNYGELAPAWYACPHYLGKIVQQGEKRIVDGGYKNSGTNPDDPLGYKCGTQMTGCGEKHGKDSGRRCICYASFCYNECIKNGGVANKHCKNVQPTKYSLFIKNHYNAQCLFLD